MKVAIIGAGIQGICTAYELACEGAQVSVFDRNNSAAEAASFANGSLLSVFATTSLLDFVGLGPAMRMPGQSRPELRWQGFSPSMLRWAQLTRKLRQGPLGASRRKDLHDLAKLSRTRLNSLCQSLRLDVDRSDGIMLVMRTERDAQQWASALREMTESGIESSTLEAAQARAMEPALREDTPLHQAVWLNEDANANCRQFALLLKTRAEELGVQFHHNIDVLPWTKASDVRHVHTTKQDHGPYDAVVVCAGMHTPRLLQPLGIRVPLQCLHGHSISAAVREPLDAPKSVVFDTRHQVSIARLGQRVRVAGAFSVGQAEVNPKPRLELLYKVLDDWFPGAARTHDNPQVWQSSVVSTPDGLPLIGRTPIPGLWLNTAHGLSGWTVACASARLLADQLAGKPTALDSDKFNLTRWSR